MVALHRTGRTADALAAYAQAREHLVEELGVEPGAQLQRLHRAILAGDAVTHADGVLPDARDWPQAVLAPGSEPLAALCDALARVRIPGTPPPEPDDLTDPHRLRELAGRLSGHAPGRRVVLVVDQLEELFMVCRDERERQAFVTALCALAGATAAGGSDALDVAPAVVALGLRADFYGHCIAYPELVPVLAGGQVVVGPMTADELRHAIARPATRAGFDA